MCAPRSSPGIGVEDRLDEAFGLADRQCLAVRLQVEVSDPQRATSTGALLLRQTQARHLWAGIRASRNVVAIERMNVGHARQLFDAQDSFVTCLVRQTWSARDVTDRIDPESAGTAPLVCDDRTALDLDARASNPRSSTLPVIPAATNTRSTVNDSTPSLVCTFTWTASSPTVTADTEAPV